MYCLSLYSNGTEIANLTYMTNPRLLNKGRFINKDLD